MASSSSSTYFLSLFLLASSLVVVARGQTGFLNIDCGKPRSYVYTDATTGLLYTSDSNYLNYNVGRTHRTSPKYLHSHESPLYDDVRSFPNGSTSCYSLRPVELGGVYLVRALFLYGNYDGLDFLPKFEIRIGRNPWDTIEISRESDCYTSEILTKADSGEISVCLVNIGSGTPFVSGIEVRPLSDSVYDQVNASQSLVTYRRWDFGATGRRVIRYGRDKYDRIWYPYNQRSWRSIRTNSPVASNSLETPPSVMATAATPIDGYQLFLNLTPRTTATPSPPTRYCVFLHFAEVELTNKTRVVDIDLNGEEFLHNVTLNYLSETTVYDENPQSYRRMEFSIKKSNLTTLPPIVNALEVYIARQHHEF